MSKLLLLGFMASGKTTFGKKFAESNNMNFIDIDQEIQKKELMSIAEIFTKKGEGYFRDLESKLLKNLLEKDNCVIATGGGVILSEKNRKIIKYSDFFVLYLTVTAKKVLEYTRGDLTRPLLLSKTQEDIEKILEKRTPLYESLADFYIEMDYQNLAQIENLIREKIEI